MNVKEKLVELLKIDFIKELMKLPLDKKTKTIKLADVKALINKIVNQLVKANPDIMETVEIMSDKKIMKRFKQKDKGKNIPLKEMEKRLKKK